jgi:D-alanyl-D-alanine carboxypeptidase (penicillin-binding protein 5/6)
MSVFMKRIILTTAFILLAAVIPTASSFALTSPPEIVAETAILIDAVTGDILYSKDMDRLKEPASTTKIMTCLLALENLPLSKVLTIDAESPFTGGSRIYIIEGEELTVEQLLYALMLESANDTGTALAIAISGSVEEFAGLMNERARELGAKNPSFKNPHGLHQQGHFATAYDLAMIAKEAMKDPDFRKIVSTVQYTIPETNKQPAREYLYNTNRLLYDAATKVPVKGVMTPAKYDGAIGVKTGYTPQAGASLVAAALRDGTELISVVLASTDLDRFGDSIALLEYGFENYYTHKAIDKSMQLAEVKVARGSVSHVPVFIEEDMYITLPTEASLSLVTTKVVMDEDITAPVERGQKLGRVEVYEGGEVIGEVAILAAADLPEGMFLSRFGFEDSTSAIVVRWAVIAFGMMAFFFVLYAVLVIRYKVKRKAMRAKRAKEIAAERERKQRDQQQRRWPY